MTTLRRTLATACMLCLFTLLGSSVRGRRGIPGSSGKEPERRGSRPERIVPIHGIHQAFFVLGGMTLLSTIVFRELKRGDGEAVSQGKELRAG
jgi:hypothetical protein